MYLLSCISSTKICFISKLAESSICSNLLHAHFLAKRNLIQELKQECLILISILVEQCLLFNIWISLWVSMVTKKCFGSDWSVSDDWKGDKNYYFLKFQAPCQYFRNLSLSKPMILLNCKIFKKKNSLSEEDYIVMRTVLKHFVICWHGINVKVFTLLLNLDCDWLIKNIITNCY